MDKPPVVPTNAELYKQINDLEFIVQRLQMDVQYLKNEHDKLKRANLGR